MRMYAIAGNHDVCSPSWFEVLKFDKGDRNIIAVGDGKLHTTPEGVTIAGLDYCHEEILRERIKTVPPADILVLHGPFEEINGLKHGGRWPLREIVPLERYRYIAAGDIHMRAETTFDTPLGPTYAVMPGSTEMSKSDEEFQKTYCEVTMKPQPIGGWDITNIEHVEFPRVRPVIPLRVTTEDELKSAIRKIEQHKHEDPLILVRYSPQVQHVKARLAVALFGSRAILRDKMDPDERMALAIGRHIDARADQRSTLAEVIERLVGNIPIRPVIDQLSLNPADPNKVIDDWIEAELGPVAEQSKL
jgi:DNA repair exonuclease SbcCD nuclease subunit